MSMLLFSGLYVLKYIHRSLSPLLYIKLDLYQSEVELLVTMCSHFPKRGSPRAVTSYNWSSNPSQVSSPMNGSFIAAVSSAMCCGTWATTFWVCSEENRQRQSYLLSFTALDVPASHDQQQEPETVQRCLSIPACIHSVVSLPDRL